jgi:uncharacterized membrane protein YhfC
MDSILYITYPLNALLMLAMVFGLGLFLTRKFHLGWRLWWIGAATFTLSQVFHIPFNILLSSLINQGVIPLPLMPAQEALALAVIFGLSAGIFENVARYLTYRFWAKDARSWGRGLLLGAGHGGIEAIFIALYVLYIFIQMAALRNADLESVVPPGQLALAQQQMEAYWSNPWYLTLLGAVERLFTLPLHLALSVMVLQVFTRGQIRWLFLAILWHAFVDGLGAVYVPRTWGVLWSLPILGVLALISVAIIFALRGPEPGEEQAEPPPPAPAPMFSLEPAEETAENLEKSRYE